MLNSSNLSETLSRHSHAFAPVLDADLNAADVCALDFSAANELLRHIDLKDTATFNEAVQQMLQLQKATIGVGGYMENRSIYSRSSHFDKEAKSRNLHLGIDVWLNAGTTVFAPLDGVIHSFQDNANFGDYGPTIILEHELEHVTFYTLYGHLTRTSLEDLQVGKPIKKGDKIAEVGPFPENGDWPPHLHFQVISSMENKSGDYPGVAMLTEKATYQQLCPNPNLILQCRHLPL
ncbi:peptidoglycan DD-metalloendopeptidase family protein [Pontibacter silvestris]|uniref:Peptidoglycan DD-metalloendopeptidase family protein n=1 Tax=Pontibacter silvestris TaxID=2305183 RepID=A0ABW4WTQ4_9BACT|nr:peptidoglycan DD-metalloendopeptidase family protein [Pontibacter silvestris]MCC9136291.1 peptidoglycan DD-metalloendopeptidase family protein [Pontibacter silvestris]